MMGNFCSLLYRLCILDIVLVSKNSFVDLIYYFAYLLLVCWRFFDWWYSKENDSGRIKSKTTSWKSMLFLPSIYSIGWHTHHAHCALIFIFFLQFLIYIHIYFVLIFFSGFFLLLLLLLATVFIESRSVFFSSLYV
jgi:hypothetical protein